MLFVSSNVIAGCCCVISCLIVVICVVCHVRSPEAVAAHKKGHQRKNIGQGIVVNVYVLDDAHIDIDCVVCLLLLMLIGVCCQEQVGENELPVGEAENQS